MNDDLRDRLDAVEDAVDPEPTHMGFRTEWVDDDGSVIAAKGAPPEDARTVIKLDARYTDPAGPEGSDR